MVMSLRTMRRLAASLAVAAMAGLTASAATAAPIGVGSTLPDIVSTGAKNSERADLVRYRGGRGINRGWRGANRGYGGRGWRGGRGRGWVGPAIVGSAIVAGAIAGSRSGYASEYRGDSDGTQRCADTFRSFDPDDGTYQPYGDGPRQECPYLND